MIRCVCINSLRATRKENKRKSARFGAIRSKKFTSLFIYLLFSKGAHLPEPSFKVFAVLHFSDISIHNQYRHYRNYLRIH
jgi:hypothetical protein